MSNQQILEKAITKAINGGWKAPGDLDHIRYKTLNIWFKTGSGKAPVGVQYPTLIFNHEFAKALWPPKLIKIHQRNQLTDQINPPEEHTLDGWQYHLQQMVIAEDPIKYLGEHLDA